MQQRCKPASGNTAQWLLVAIFLVTVLVPGLASAGEQCRNGQVVLKNSTESVRDFGGCISYLEDAGQLYLLPDILAMEPERFTRHESGVLNFGYTESAYWTRFDLRADTGEAGTEWILELALPLVDEVVLYLVRDGELIGQRKAGYQDNWAERDLAVPNPTFRLHLEPGSVTSVYLRIINTNTFRLPVSLWSPDCYIEKVSVDEVIRGALLGSLLAILAYNLFVAVSVRERSNIYYVLYLVSAAVFIATEQVHGIQLLESRPVLLNKEYLHYQIIMTWFWGLLMARALLETRARSMDLDRVIKMCISSVLLTFVLSLFLPYHVAMEWIVIGSMLLCIILIVVSYLSWRYPTCSVTSHCLITPLRAFSRCRPGDSL